MNIFHAFDNIFGGHDMTLGNGETISTHDNVFGGHDIYDNGHLIGSSHEHIGGGEDYYHDGHLIGSSHENMAGGHDHYEHGHLIGSSHPNAFGGEDYYEHGHLRISTHHYGRNGIEIQDYHGGHTHTENNVIDILGTNQETHHMGHGVSLGYEAGNFSTIMGYGDPLAHVSDYIMPTLML